MSIEKIWAEYRAAMTSFLRLRISNPADIDDLLQDIFLKINKNLHTLKSQASIKSWLFQVANHTIIDFYRKNKKVNLVDDLVYTDLTDDHTQEALSQCIEIFIKALPEKARKLLTEIDIQGISQKNYAMRHGIKYSTLKSQVKKSRYQLRKLFESCCYFSFDQQGNIIDFYPKSTHCQKCHSCQEY